MHENETPTTESNAEARGVTPPSCRRLATCRSTRRAHLRRGVSPKINRSRNTRSAQRTSSTRLTPPSPDRPRSPDTGRHAEPSNLLRACPSLFPGPHQHATDRIPACRVGRRRVTLFGLCTRAPLPPRSPWYSFRSAYDALIAVCALRPPRWEVIFLSRITTA